MMEFPLPPKSIDGHRIRLVTREKNQEVRL